MKQHDTMEAVNMTTMLEDVKASDETDTTKSRGTPTTSDTASSSSTLNDEPESLQYDDTILTQLARQLEYYFSQANLEKDTYVETLRNLNDGYVPVSILQRFQKVQAFTPIETEDAIVKAATEFSSLLEVVFIHTKTGKRVEDASGNTLLAVGTISGEPLDNSGLGSVVPITPKSPAQNTIIIREVDPSITEEEVRALFDEDGPSIQSLYLDVFNCWFVTMDTESRDDMLYVMMQLRAQYLGDEPVKARMKSVVRQVDPTHAPGLPVLSPVSSYTHLSNMPNGNKKRKQKKRSKNGANNNSGNKGTNNPGGKKNAAQNKGNKEAGNTKKVETQQPKPDLSAASFPALTDDIKKVEVVVDGIESTPNPVASDACSTVTTVSSSSSAGKQLGGYAAALLKARPAEKDEGSVQSSSNQSSTDSQSQAWKADTETTNKQPIAPIKAAQVVVKPPVWGGGRSFADVLAM